MTIYSVFNDDLQSVWHRRRDDHTGPLNEGGLHQPGLHGGLGHQHHRLRQLSRQPEQEPGEIIVQGFRLLQVPARDDC